MNILFYFSVWALASTFGAACAIGARKEKKGAGVSIQKGSAVVHKEERDPESERVRAIIFDAYKDLKKHTPGLDLLTACLTRPGVSRNTAIFALERTLERLEGRYNIKPVERAINALKSL